MPHRSSALVLVLLLGACGGGGGQPQGGGGKRPVPVAVEPVSAQEVTYAVRANGTIAAFETVTIAARVAGVVERLSFREGDAVTPDTVLAEIDPQRYALRAAAAAADLAAAEADLAEARSALRRREALAASGDGRVAADEVESLRAKVASAEAQVANRTAGKRLAELDGERARVRPPMAGIIQSRLVQTGQQVAEGTALATLIRRDPLQVRFTVTEEEGGRLAVGMATTVLVAGQDRAAAAKITYVAAAVDATTRRIQVIADVDGGDAPRLRPGAFAEVVVAISSAERPAVPQSAIRPSERGFLAYVVEGETAKERVVTLGLRTADGRIEVRSGLAAGETLVVRGAEALDDGRSLVVDGKAHAEGAKAGGAQGKREAAK
jgi:multidrug efflux system membrane fusion protein